MDSQPELWAFVLANIGLFLISSVLTVLSYIAYRQSNSRSSYRTATIGFGVVVLGGLVEPVYQLAVRGDFNVSGGELILLQTGETLLIAIGLGLLFYAIVNHGSNAPSDEETIYPYDSREFNNKYE